MELQFFDSLVDLIKFAYKKTKDDYELQDRFYKNYIFQSHICKIGT